MNFLLATSRGGGIETLMDRDTHITNLTYPGATLDRLNNIAKHNITYSTHGNPTHIYILAGIPNITHKIKHHYPRTYTECIYTGNKEQTVLMIKDKFSTIAKTINDKGGKPIFCTITNTNIAHYNNSLLASRKTHTLKYSHRYDTMQADITYIIDELNYYLRQVNKENKVSTPFCHGAIRTKKGKTGKHYYTDNWEGLRDGVHATLDTRKKWAKNISHAIRLNRNLPKPTQTTTQKRKQSTSDSEEECKSPKRAWKKERGVTSQ